MKYIADMEAIVGRHGGIMKALRDKEGQYALMMCMLQIGELSKIITDETFIHQLPLRNASAFRNRIAHEYETM